MDQKRLLLIGATGVFGRRLASHLGAFNDIKLIVSSRSAKRATELAERLKLEHPALVVSGTALDHRQNLQQQLDLIKPWAVVDASGPFQGAGYEVPKAALETGAHVVDLADALDYLKHYSQSLDRLAKSKGLAAVTGASSTPALSSAVVEALVKGWRRVDTIDICILPAGRSEVGQAVVAAILSYAGKSVPVWKDGQLSAVTGWLRSKPVDLPGLGIRRAAPVETFDAELLGPRFNVTDRIVFSAGLESPVEQFGIQVLARLRHGGWLKNLRPLAPLLIMARKMTRIAMSECGGMLVEASGIGHDGAPRLTRWTLLAKSNHGPFVPVMPVAAVVRKLIADDVASGANTADNILNLTEITNEMASYDIATKITD